MNATVGDVMTTRVIAVRKDASFKEMVAMLRSSRISAFPVVDDAGRVVGVVSEADLLVKERFWPTAGAYLPRCGTGAQTIRQPGSPPVT